MAEQPFDTTWIDSFGGSIGLPGPDQDEIAALLALAGRAARDSGDRRNAPLSCFLVGLALGRSGEAVTAGAIDAM